MFETFLLGSVLHCGLRCWNITIIQTFIWSRMWREALVWLVGWGSLVFSNQESRDLLLVKTLCWLWLVGWTKQLWSLWRNDKIKSWSKARGQKPCQSLNVVGFLRIHLAAWLERSLQNALVFDRAKNYGSSMTAALLVWTSQSGFRRNSNCTLSTSWRPWFLAAWTGVGRDSTPRCMVERMIWNLPINNFLWLQKIVTFCVWQSRVLMVGDLDSSGSMHHPSVLLDQWQVSFELVTRYGFLEWQGCDCFGQLSTTITRSWLVKNSEWVRGGLVRASSSCLESSSRSQERNQFLFRSASRCLDWWYLQKGWVKEFWKSLTLKNVVQNSKVRLKTSWNEMHVLGKKQSGCVDGWFSSKVMRLDVWPMVQCGLWADGAITTRELWNLMPRCKPICNFFMKGFCKLKRFELRRVCYPLGTSSLTGLATKMTGLAVLEECYSQSKWKMCIILFGSRTRSLVIEIVWNFQRIPFMSSRFYQCLFLQCCGQCIWQRLRQFGTLTMSLQGWPWFEAQVKLVIRRISSISSSLLNAKSSSSRGLLGSLLSQTLRMVRRDWSASSYFH